MGAHLDRVIANCASSRFALRTLRAHSLPPPELHLVTRMTTVSSLMYASPSWWASPTRQIGRDSSATVTATHSQGPPLPGCAIIRSIRTFGSPYPFFITSRRIELNENGNISPVLQ